MEEFVLWYHTRIVGEVAPLTGANLESSHGVDPTISYQPSCVRSKSSPMLPRVIEFWMPCIAGPKQVTKRLEKIIPQASFRPSAKLDWSLFFVFFAPQQSMRSF